MGDDELLGVADEDALDGELECEAVGDAGDAPLVGEAEAAGVLAASDAWWWSCSLPSPSSMHSSS